jgi:hypothetical protein
MIGLWAYPSTGVLRCQGGLACASGQLHLSFGLQEDASRRWQTEAFFGQNLQGSQDFY